MQDEIEDQVNDLTIEPDESDLDLAPLDSTTWDDDSESTEDSPEESDETDEPEPETDDADIEVPTHQQSLISSFKGTQQELTGWFNFSVLHSDQIGDTPNCDKPWYRNTCFAHIATN